MNKQLIVNADDFGLSPAINYGIVDAHRHGVVTSTTAMLNAPAIEHAAQLSSDFPHLGVGLHFVLSYGRALTPLSTLAREGRLGKWVWEVAQQGRLDEREVAAELEAQYQRFLLLFGRKPTHIDSHHHVHLIPLVWAQVARFASEKDLPVRVDRPMLQQQGISPLSARGTAGFERDFYGDNVTADYFVQALEASSAQGESSLEIMCHPGFVDNEVLKSGYNTQRLTEWEVLTSGALKSEVASRGYRLATYGDI